MRTKPIHFLKALNWNNMRILKYLSNDTSIELIIHKCLAWSGKKSFRGTDLPELCRVDSLLSSPLSYPALDLFFQLKPWLNFYVYFSFVHFVCLLIQHCLDHRSCILSWPEI